MYHEKRKRLEITGKTFGPRYSMDKVEIEGMRASWLCDKDGT